MQRKAEERELQRRLTERLEKERLESLYREQERLALAKQDAEARELRRQVSETFIELSFQTKKQCIIKRHRLLINPQVSVISKEVKYGFWKDVDATYCFQILKKFLL